MITVAEVQGRQVGGVRSHENPSWLLCITRTQLSILPIWPVGQKDRMQWFSRALVYPQFQDANCAVFIYALNESRLSR